MSDEVRQGLGLLCVATICLIGGLALADWSEMLAALLRFGALLVGVTGLGFIASGLLRKD